MAAGGAGGPWEVAIRQLLAVASRARRLLVPRSIGIRIRVSRHSRPDRMDPGPRRGQALPLSPLAAARSTRAGRSTTSAARAGLRRGAAFGNFRGARPVTHDQPQHQERGQRDERDRRGDGAAAGPMAYLGYPGQGPDGGPAADRSMPFGLMDPPRLAATWRRSLRVVLLRRPTRDAGRINGRSRTRRPDRYGAPPARPLGRRIRLAGPISRRRSGSRSRGAASSAGSTSRAFASGSLPVPGRRRRIQQAAFARSALDDLRAGRRCPKSPSAGHVSRRVLEDQFLSRSARERSFFGDPRRTAGPPSFGTRRTACGRSTGTGSWPSSTRRIPTIEDPDDISAPRCCSMPPRCGPRRGLRPSRFWRSFAR